MPKRSGKFEGADLSQGQGLPEPGRPRMNLPRAEVERAPITTYLVKMDKRKSFRALVKENKFDDVSPEIRQQLGNEELFDEHKTNGDIEVGVISLDSRMNSEDIVELMRQKHFRPATAKELAAFALQHPNFSELTKKGVQSLHTIALGSQIDIRGRPHSSGSKYKIGVAHVTVAPSGRGPTNLHSLARSIHGSIATANLVLSGTVLLPFSWSTGTERLTVCMTQKGKFEGAELSKGQGGEEVASPITQETEAVFSSSRELRPGDGQYLLTIDQKKSLKELLPHVFKAVTPSIQDAVYKDLVPDVRSQSQVLAEIMITAKEYNMDQLTAQMAQRGVRPATIAELAAFTTAYPEMLTNEWLTTLGSSFSYGYKTRVFGAKKYLDGVELALESTDIVWPEEWRFLVIRD